jgi:hypothetical protein
MLTQEPIPDALTLQTQKLKKYFDRLNAFDKFFFPKALKSALETTPLSNIDIIHAAFSSTWFFHVFFFPTGLRTFFHSDTIKSTQWLFDPDALPKGAERDRLNLSRVEQRAKALGYLPPLDKVNRLKDFYQKLHWFKKLFFPYELGKCLADESSTPLKIIHIAHLSTSPFQRIFFPTILKHFFKDRSIIQANSLLDVTVPVGKKRVENNIATLKALPHAETITNILCLISRIKQLSPASSQYNLDTLRTHPNQKSVVNALILLNEQGEFSSLSGNPQELFDTVCKSLLSSHADGIITIMKRIGLLSNKNSQSKNDFLHVLNLPKMGHIDDALKILDRCKLLTPPHAQANFKAVVQGYPMGYRVSLQPDDLLADFRIEPRKVYITAAKEALKYTVMDPSDPSKTKTGLIPLTKLSHLQRPITQQGLEGCLPLILNEVSANQHTQRTPHMPIKLLDALKALDTAKQLTQASFNQIIIAPNPIDQAQRILHPAPAPAPQIDETPAAAVLTAAPALLEPIITPVVEVIDVPLDDRSEEEDEIPTLINMARFAQQETSAFLWPNAVPSDPAAHDPGHADNNEESDNENENLVPSLSNIILPTLNYARSWIPFVPPAQTKQQPPPQDTPPGAVPAPPASWWTSVIGFFHHPAAVVEVVVVAEEHDPAAMVMQEDAQDDAVVAEQQPAAVVVVVEQNEVGAEEPRNQP